MPDERIKRVLMTTDTVGGVWTFSLELARGLAADGVEVVLAALGGQPSPDQTREAKRIPGVCLLSSDFKLEWMDDPWDDVDKSGQWLLRLEREYSPDLVHLNSFGHGALPWRAPTIMTAHSCVLSWWTAVRGGDAPSLWDHYRAEVTKALHSVGTVTAPSAVMADTLTQNYALAPSRVQVIHNGVTASAFTTGEKEPFIFTAGRLWDDAKNVAALANIAPLPWPVYLAGDQPNRFTFTGCHALGKLSADAMSTWYSRASIYALPARYEPFGLSVVEAALSGCALVLGDIPSLREIWGDAALFTPPDDQDALRAAIEQLIARPDFRGEMSQRARNRALFFNSARTTRRHLDLYRALVSNRKGQCVT